LIGFSAVWNEVDHMPFYATSGLTRQIRHFK
jgi:hypothetical protein